MRLFIVLACALAIYAEPVDLGRTSFAKNCTACHGADGKGGRAPDLTKARGSDASVERVIQEGVAGTMMPGFHLPAGEAKAVVAFLRTLRVSSAEAKAMAELITLRNGKKVQGLVGGEDTFTLHVGSAVVDKSLIAKREPLPTVPELPGIGVTFERLRHSEAEPQNWLTYWGDLRGTHFSRLSQITPANAPTLASQWSYQFSGPGVEATPLVIDGVMYLTGPLNDAVALDARTGTQLWKYHRPLPEVHKNCTVMANRGFAVLGDLLYMATLDAHLVALNARTGKVVFDVEVDDYRKGFSITHAPLAVDGKIIVGITAGECALNGYVDAYDALTGKKVWRSWAIAQPGDPARTATWAGKSAETGGGPTWMTGTYDAELKTLFWTTGNPSPDYDGSQRSGDNLYTCSVLALDPDTGKLKWYFQFTPHDTHDWDANEVPVLVDANWRGKPRKLLLQANRNAFYYVLDRTTGEYLHGQEFARQTWAKGLDAKGRPIVLPNTDPTPAGNYVCPDATGATNWNSPSYDATKRLFFLAVTETCATYTSITKEPDPGLPFTGTGVQLDEKIKGPGSIRALDALTGKTRWSFPTYSHSHSAGVLGTAGGVLFAATKEGYLIGLESGTGKLLWKYQTGAEIRSSPMAFAVDGREYIGVTNNASVMVFALPNHQVPMRSTKPALQR